MSRATRKMSAWATASSTSVLINPMVITPWVPAHGIAATQFRVLGEIRQRTGNYQHKLAWQTANVTTLYPEAWAFSATNRTANGIVVEDFPPSVAWTGRMWVRAGLGVSASSGTGEAQVSAQAMYPGIAHIIAARPVQVQPDLNTSQASYYPITGEFAALGLTEIMVACSVTGVSGTLTYQPAVRYYNDALDALGAWTDLGTAASPAVNELRNFDGQTVNPGLIMWAQVGIKVTSTSARASIQSVVSAKY